MDAGCHLLSDQVQCLQADYGSFFYYYHHHQWQRRFRNIELITAPSQELLRPQFHSHLQSTPCKLQEKERIPKATPFQQNPWEFTQTHFQVCSFYLAHTTGIKMKGSKRLWCFLFQRGQGSFGSNNIQQTSTTLYYWCISIYALLLINCYWLTSTTASKSRNTKYQQGKSNKDTWFCGLHGTKQHKTVQNSWLITSGCIAGCDVPWVSAWWWWMGASEGGGIVTVWRPELGHTSPHTTIKSR